MKSWSPSLQWRSLGRYPRFMGMLRPRTQKMTSLNKVIINMTKRIFFFIQTITKFYFSNKFDILFPPPIRIFGSHKVQHPSGAYSDLSGISREQEKQVNTGHNMSEGNMLTRHHSQTFIPKINTFMFPWFFQLPKYDAPCIQSHL